MRAETQAGAAARNNDPSQQYNEILEAIETRIKDMATSVSGASETRWFAHPDTVTLPLPKLTYGVETSLRDRAKGTLMWIFALFNIPPGAHRIQPDIFGREFAEITGQHTELWTELVNVARVQRDMIGDGEEQDRFAKRLEESERCIAYSHEVMFCAAMVWKHLAELLYLQCQEGGNIFDSAVPDRMRISDQRAWDVRKMLSDPMPLEEETGQKKTRDMQLVIEHLLARASHERYRKRDHTVYQQKCVDHCGARYSTCTWVPACFKAQRSNDESSMESFVLHYCKREHYPVVWEALVRCLPVKKIVDFMVMCDDSEFPTVYPKRNLLAFRNGIYDTCAGGAGAFYQYGSGMTNSNGQAAAKFFDAIVPSEVHEICCEGHDGWWNIDTPLFQSILDYQEWGAKAKYIPRTQGDEEEPDEPSAAHWAAVQIMREMEEVQRTLESQLTELRLLPEAQVRDAAECITEHLQDMIHDLDSTVKRKLYDRFGMPEDDGRLRVRDAQDSAPPSTRHDSSECASRLPREAQRFIYVFMGRMLHELGHHDQWQIIPFFKGRGGSGKSTIAQVVQKFFEPTDVGILSNNSEKKFGLQPLLDKFIWMCLELKKNVQLDQAEFQSMVSGEDLSVAIKNQVARAIKWNAPGLLCGNEAPSWIDAQGSIARRMAIINFPYSLRECDVVPDLKERIYQSELAKLIIKCNVAYREECNRHRKCDIWKILPQYFKDERLRFQKDTDAVYAAVFDSSVFELWTRKENNPEDFASYYVPLSAIENHYRQKWRDLRASSYPDPFTPEKYESAFGQAGIRIDQDTKLDPESQIMRWDFWVIGIRAICAGRAPQASA